MLNTYNTARKNNRLTTFEVTMFGLQALLTLVSITLFFADKIYFEMFYSPEGGFTGYLTVLLLVAIFGVCVVYVVKLARYRSIQFCIVFTLMGIASLLIAARTMAVLPDVFHVATHSLFKINTAVLHTTATSIAKVNEIGKIAIQWLLIFAGSFYVLLLPFIYRGNFSVKRFIDKAGIPVPHRNHIIAIVVLAFLALIFSGVKDSEILRLNLTAIFFLIVLCPENIGVFRR